MDRRNKIKAKENVARSFRMCEKVQIISSVESFLFGKSNDKTKEKFRDLLNLHEECFFKKKGSKAIYY